MKITVKLFATLRTGRFDEKVIQFSNNITISDTLKEIGITSQEAAIIFVNGRHAEFDQVLYDGDIVSIFPPIGGG